MAKEEKRRSQIPRFKSREEEAHFWDTHDTPDFPDEFIPVEVHVARPLGHILGVRLDARTIGRLATIARRLGIGPSTLARIWIMERLNQMEEGKTALLEGLQSELKSV